MQTTLNTALQKKWAWKDIVALVLLFSCVHAHGDAAIDEPVRPGTDPRLTRQYDITAHYATLGEVLAEVSKASGVPIAAKGNIAQENLTVIIRHKPVGEVLDMLAENLGYDWFKTDDNEGYELSQSAASRNREKELRRKLMLQALASINEDMKAMEQYHRTIPPEMLLDKIYALQNELKKPGITEENKAHLSREVQRLDAALGDGPLAPMLTLFQRLSDDQLTKLKEKKILKFSFAGIRGMERLGGDVVKGILRRGDDDSVQWYRDHPPTDVRAEFRLSVTTSGLSLVAKDQRFGPPPPEFASRAEPVFRLGSPVNADTAANRRTEAEQAVLLKSDSPILIRKTKLTGIDKSLDSTNPSTYLFPGHQTVTDILVSLSQKEEEASFISDAYLRDIDFALKADESTGQLLNRLASASRSRVRFDPRGYILVRSNETFLLRPQSIPAPILRKMYNLEANSDGLMLNDYVWLASQLTDEQTESLLDAKGREILFRLPSLNVWTLREMHDSFRLLAVLPDRLFNRLINSERVAFNDLDSRSRSAFVQVLENYDSLHESDQIRVILEEELRGLGLRLRSKRPDNLNQIQGAFELTYEDSMGATVLKCSGVISPRNNNSGQAAKERQKNPVEVRPLD